MAKILVTGGVGFIGSHIVNRLTKNGHNITILDCFNYASDIRRLEYPIEILKYNLVSTEWVDKIKNFDLIIKIFITLH